MLFLPYPDFHPAHAVLPGEPIDAASAGRHERLFVSKGIVHVAE